MDKERLIRDIREIDTNTSGIVICQPKTAEEFVEKFLQMRVQNNEKAMTIIIDGRSVVPQQRFAQSALEHRYGDKEYLSDKAITAGLFLAILEKTIEEAKKWAKNLGQDYDTTWEEKVVRIVRGYPSYDTDKISTASGALEYAEKAVERLGLEKVTLLLLNSDKLDHPGFGPRYNEEMLRPFIISHGHNKVNVLLFREKRVNKFTS